jgi:glucose-1-phosphate thymidylyltransferase
MKTIILAGGYATRFYPITLNRPKPLLPVAGRPIIDYILESSVFSDPPIVSTNRRFAEQFVRWRTDSDKDVQLVIEETTDEEGKLGTVGALSFLIHRLNIDDDILVVGGDNIFDFPLEALLSSYRGNPLVALCDIKDMELVRGRYGVAIVQGGKIVDFQEKPQRPRSTLASTACYVYPPKTFPLIDEFLSVSEEGSDAPGYLNEWLLKEQGMRIDPFVFEGGWYDIGDRSSYIVANQHYSGRDTVCGGNVIIERSTVRGSVLLDEVRIEDSSIVGCIIDRGCSLKGVDLNGCLVGEGSDIRSA